MALLTCVFFPVFFPRTSCCQRPRWRPRSPSAWPSPPASSPRARSPVRRARARGRYARAGVRNAYARVGVRNAYARAGVRNSCACRGGKRVRISGAWRGGGICARAGAGSRCALRGEEGMHVRAPGRETPLCARSVRADGSNREPRAVRFGGRRAVRFWRPTSGQILEADGCPSRAGRRRRERHVDGSNQEPQVVNFGGQGVSQ